MPMVLAALLGALVSGAGAWVSWGRVVVTRADVSAMILHESPYVEDQKVFVMALGEIDHLHDEIVELRVEMARLGVLLKEVRYQMNSKVEGPVQ